MRKVTYGMAVSLDGFIEDAKGEITWSLIDEELHQHFNDQEGETGVHLYGRRLYQIMAAYWPTADEDPSASPVEIEYAHIWKNMPKIVFSKTLDQVGWNSRLVRGDVAAEVNQLKGQPGKDISIGGAGLAATCMQLGLIDEYSLYVNPLILGGGKPMFAQLRDKINLKLVETRTFRSGVVLLKYRRDNEHR
jgi:dihydrofolate reductase